MRNASINWRGNFRVRKNEEGYKDDDNPRGFPRFAKNPKPQCPIHNKTMRSHKEPIPAFLSIALGYKADVRTVWRCRVKGCPRVEHGTVNVFKSQERMSEGWMSQI